MNSLFKKFVFLSLVVFVGWMPIHSQDLPEILWDKTIGGNFADHLGAILPAPDGGWYLFGTSSSSVGFEKSAAPYTLFGNDIWMLKYNSNWEKEWDKVIGGTNEESLSGVVPAPEGGFVIAATSRSNISGEKSENTRSPDMEDYWVIKVDYDGNKVWDRTYGGADIDDLNSIRRHPWGGYVLAGTSYSGQSGEKSHPSFGKQDWWVLWINENGGIIWDRVFGGERFEQGAGIYRVLDGFILTGKSDSPVSGNKTAEPRGSYDAWMVKINFSGEKQWDKAFGGDENEGGAGITLANDGGYMLSISSKSDISGDKTTPDVGGNDAWFVKVDSTFEIEWDKTLGTVHQDNLGASRAGSGGYLLTGTYVVEEAQPGGGIIDFGQRWMIHTDDELNEIWDFKFGGDKNETGGGAWLLRSDTTLLLLGSGSDSDASGEKTEDSRGGPDMWLTMLQMPFGLYTEVKPQPELNHITLYPNPVSGNHLYLVSDHLEFESVVIHSLTGAIAMEIRDIGNSRAHISVGALAPGIYLSTSFMSDGSRINRKFIRQ